MSPVGDPFLLLIIGLFAALGAFRGGFIALTGTGALLAGIALGFVVAAPVGAITGSNRAVSLTVMFGAIFGVTVMALRFSEVSAWWKSRAPAAFGGPGDRLVGAAVGTFLGASLAWVIVIVLSAAPTVRSLHGELSQSAVAQTLLEYGPSVSASTRWLARTEFFPALVGPLVTVDAPDPAAVDGALVAAAETRVLRISVAASCGDAIGSGWVYARGVVITNAHVVAGTQPGGTKVSTAGSSSTLDATVVAFDAIADVAVLSVPQLGLGPLTRAQIKHEGEDAVVLGHTLKGRYVAPARYDFETTWDGVDIYDNAAPERPIDVFRANVYPGNSGGPLVNRNGQVMSTVYASTVDQPREGGYGIPNEVVDRVVARAGATPVATGPCSAE